MTRLPRLLLATTLLTLALAASASAQATRTWVSGVGDDMNPCSRTARAQQIGVNVIPDSDPVDVFLNRVDLVNNCTHAVKAAPTGSGSTLKVTRKGRTVATISRAAKAGANAIAWRPKKAKAGRYDVALRALGADGQVSTAKATVRLR